MANYIRDWLFPDADNVLKGTNAADEIDGFGGDDRIFANSGHDTVRGGSGDDVLWGGQGNDDIFGGSGRDTIIIDQGNNAYDGDSNIDKLVFADVETTFEWLDLNFQVVEATTGFSVDLETGETRRSTVGSDAFTVDWGTNTFTSIEEYRMTNHADVFRGDDGGDLIEMGGGNDVVEGRGGADAIFGDGGTDTATYASSTAGVNVDLTRATQQGGDAQGDTLTSIENLIGSAFDDRLEGGANNNTLEGGGGRDEIIGGGGRDILRGGSGADVFIFEAITDSQGNFNQRDVVEDFSRTSLFPGLLGSGKIAGDKIDLAAIDGDQRAGHGGHQDLFFVGNGAFTDAGQVRIARAQDAEGRTFSIVEAEVTGDGVADFRLSVFTADNALLTSSDLIL